MRWACDGCLIVRVVVGGVSMGDAAGLVGVGVSGVGVLFVVFGWQGCRWLVGGDSGCVVWLLR